MKKYLNSLGFVTAIIISFLLVKGLKIIRSTSYHYLLVLYTIIFYIFRYSILFKNFISAINKSKKKEYNQIKGIFYFNFFNLCFNIILVYFKFTVNYYSLNLFILYPEVIITTIFNIPILYIVLSKIIKSRLVVFFIRVILVLMFAYNIYLLIDGEFLKSLIWLP